MRAHVCASPPDSDTTTRVFQACCGILGSASQPVEVRLQACDAMLGMLRTFTAATGPALFEVLLGVESPLYSAAATTPNSANNELSAAARDIILLLLAKKQLPANHHGGPSHDAAGREAGKLLDLLRPNLSTSSNACAKAWSALAVVCSVLWSARIRPHPLSDHLPELLLKAGACQVCF